MKVIISTRHARHTTRQYYSLRNGITSVNGNKRRYIQEHTYPIRAVKITLRIYTPPLTYVKKQLYYHTLSILKIHFC